MHAASAASGESEARHYLPLAGPACIGAVVGPGGARLAAIRAESGATIDVGDVAPGQTVAPVAISGDRASVDAALQLIRVALEGASSDAP